MTSSSSVLCLLVLRCLQGGELTWDVADSLRRGRGLASLLIGSLLAQRGGEPRWERLALQRHRLQLLQEAAMAEDGDQPVVWIRTEANSGTG